VQEKLGIQLQNDLEQKKKELEAIEKELAYKQQEEKEMVEQRQEYQRQKLQILEEQKENVQQNKQWIESSRPRSHSQPLP